jgi:hypothetical protein
MAGSEPYSGDKELNMYSDDQGGGFGDRPQSDEYGSVRDLRSDGAAASEAEIAYWSAIASGVAGADELGHDDFIRQLHRAR